MTSSNKGKLELGNIKKRETDEVIMTNFRFSILKSKVLPCISNDIDVIIKNRRRWEIIGTASDYLENLFIAMSFIFLIVNNRLIVSIIMGCIACCKHSDSFAQRKQTQLTDKLNEYLKSLGIKESILNIDDENEIEESKNNDLENGLKI